MAEVVNNLSSVPASDVRAIAIYMADISGVAPQDRKLRGEAALAHVKSVAPTGADAPGASIYAAACATCHESDRPLPYGGVNLGLSTALSAPDPRNAANVILSGILPREGERSPIMPGFAGSMTDAQAAALLNYLRGRFSNQPAWTGVEKAVQEARRVQTVFLQPAAGPHNAPGDTPQRDKP